MTRFSKLHHLSGRVCLLCMRALVALIPCVAQCTATEPSTRAPSIADVRRRLCERDDAVRALKIAISAKQRALVHPALLKTYLNQAYLRDDTHTFAYKGDLRFHQIDQPRSIDAIDGTAEVAAPFAGASPETVDRVERIRREQQAARKVATEFPHAASFAASRIELPEKEVWAFAGADELRHLGGTGGALFSITTDHYYQRAFDCEYLNYLGLAVPDPTFESTKAAPHPLTTSNRLCAALRYNDYSLNTSDGAGNMTVEVGRVVEHMGIMYSERIFLNRELGYLPTRRLLADNMSGSRVAEWTFSDPVEIVENVWLPQQIVFIQYPPAEVAESVKRVPILETLFTLKAFAVNDDVPDELFQLAFAPGVRVSDFIEGRRLAADTKGGPLRYTMPAGSDGLNDALRSATMTGSVALRRVILAVLNVAVVLVAISYFVFRSRSKRRGA